jgi:hypothetical protein
MFKKNSRIMFKNLDSAVTSIFLYSSYTPICPYEGLGLPLLTFSESKVEDIVRQQTRKRGVNPQNYIIDAEGGFCREWPPGGPRIFSMIQNSTSSYIIHTFTV